MKKLLLFLVLLALPAYGQTAVGNITILGATCAVTNACVIDTLYANSGAATIVLTGTWTGTVPFEASPDGGTTWVAINGTPPNSTTAVTSATANGVWSFNVAAMTHIRARASALASGTVGVNINASPAAANSRGGSAGGTTLVASGTSALGTGAITNATCATVVTTAASGALTTDNMVADFTVDPTSTTGYNPAAAAQSLTIFKYITAGNVNFKVCNFTTGSITPGAVTLQWKVIR